MNLFVFIAFIVSMAMVFASDKEVEKCCSDVMLNSYGPAKITNPDKLGKFKFYSQHDNKKAYKLVGANYYLFWKSSKQQWQVSKELDETLYMYTPQCNETCVENCPVNWKVWNGTKGVSHYQTDETMSTVCERGLGYIGHSECAKKCTPNTLGTTCNNGYLVNGCEGYCGCGNYRCEKCNCVGAPVCKAVTTQGVAETVATKAATKGVTEKDKTSGVEPSAGFNFGILAMVVGSFLARNLLS